MMGFSYEKRPLKRPRLGPPDVYPQEPKQKEDELTSTNVKHGFATMPQLSDEFGTARNCNITAAKVAEYFNGILTKKEELNTLPDMGRKRQQINPKDNFWPATARTKNAVEAWFKDLAGSKPLSSLSKKAPNFNKKEEIFSMLCEYQVPMLRATWFIKLSYAYTVAVSEVKIKRRQLTDPTQEWTATLIKYLKDQLSKLQDYYHTPGSSNAGSTPNPASSTPTGAQTVASPSPHNAPPAISDEQKAAMRQWQYCTQLAKYLYEEGLLERQELLQWLLDLLDQLRSAPAAEDGVLRLLLPLTLQYIHEFSQSELLARKLGYLCARKLAQLCCGQEPSIACPSPPPIVISSSPGAPSLMNPVAAMFSEYMTCSHHRDIVLSLSAIIQLLNLEGK